MPVKAKPQGFVPNSFFKEQEHKLRAILAKPVESPGDYVANLYDLLDFTNSFVIELQKLIQARWAVDMLQQRKDSLRNLLQAAKQQAEYLDRNVLPEAGDARSYLRFRFVLAVQESFAKKARTTRNALKHSWTLKAGYVDAQVDKLLAGASPEVIEALRVKSDPDLWDSNASYVIHKWDSKVGFDRLAQKAILIEEGPPSLARIGNWVSWIRSLLESNYGQDALGGQPTSEFDLYGLKVIVQDSTVSPRDIDDYVKRFDAVYELLKSKGLGSVWQGKIFIRCAECGGKNPLGEHFGVGGDYNYTTDTINVYLRPSSGILSLLVHELGHRYWFKGMSKGQRGRFESYVRVNGPGLDEEDTRDVEPVSPYGAQNIEEAFAEVFRDYVLGRDLTSDQLESFRAVLKRASTGREAQALTLLRAARRLLVPTQRVAAGLKGKIEALRPKMIAAAQAILDDWVVDDEGFDVEFGSGGACDAINRAIQDVLDDLDGVTTQDGGQDGDDHAYSIVHDGTEAYVVDIPANVYEVGGGYSWKKRKNVKLRPSDIVIESVRLDDVVEHEARTVASKDPWASAMRLLAERSTDPDQILRLAAANLARCGKVKP